MTASAPAPRLRVRTASSTYLVDLEEGWISRQPGEDSAVLSYDAERITLVGMGRPIALGHPMVLVLSGLATSGALTVRLTTPVVEIAPVERG